MGVRMKTILFALAVCFMLTMMPNTCLDRPYGYDCQIRLNDDSLAKAIAWLPAPPVIVKADVLQGPFTKQLQVNRER